MSDRTVPSTIRQWIVSKPVEGPLQSNHFEALNLPLAPLQPHEALVRVVLLNLHPAIKMRMQSGRLAVGQSEESNFALAEVIQSRDRAFQPGDFVACQAGWQDYQIISSKREAVLYGPALKEVRSVNGTESQYTYVLRPELTRSWDPGTLMEVFGTSGFTAWFGMRECGPLRPDQQVAVAGATGSVGSLISQIAKAAGCHVVGFGGGQDRCRRAKELNGLDECLDYRSPSFAEHLREAFPEGIDIFSDGVSGPLTEIVIRMINPGGRLLAYGAAKDLHDTGATAGSLPVASVHRGATLRAQFGVTPEIERIATERQITIECWTVSDFYHERIAAEDALSVMLRTGELKPVHAVFSGFGEIPRAVLSMYDPAVFGKVQVAL